MAHWVAGVAARRQQLITLHTAFGRDPLRIAAEPLIRDVVERLWKLQGVPPGPDREYAVSAATGVTLAVTNTWIARGFEEDAAHVTKVLATLLTPGSERFYSRYRTAK